MTVADSPLRQDLRNVLHRLRNEPRPNDAGLDRLVAEALLAIENLLAYNHKEVGETPPLRITRARVTLRDTRTGAQYGLTQSWDTLIEHGIVRLAWEIGRYSCDCSRSHAIQGVYGAEVMPDLDCGSLIQLVDLDIKDE